MKRRTTVFVFLLLASALVVTAALVVGNRPASGQDSSGEPANPIARINNKAALLNTGDETQIRELADDVFATFELDQVPAGLVEGLKNRLIRAEVNYRTGRGKPVSEFGVVRMVNTFADEVGAPPYAKTNVFEVRRLEMHFLPLLTKFIGRKPAGKGDGPKERGSSFNATMSPLEAFTIAGLVIQQKRFNPSYQVTQQEYLAKRKAKDKKKDGLQDALSTKRNEDFDKALQRATDGKSVADLMKLSHQALDKLGVARAEGRSGQ